MKPSYLIAALAVAAAQCSSPTAPDTIVPVVRLYTDAFSGFAQAGQMVIRDEATWHQEWATSWRFTAPAPDAPVVDFSRDMVVIVAMGSRPSSGYSVTIESATERGNEVTIAVLATSPGQGCGVATVITNPVDMVRLPRHGTVSFVERKLTKDCS